MKLFIFLTLLNWILGLRKGKSWSNALCIFGKRGPKMFNFEVLFLHGFSSKNCDIWHKAVCDETQNLNDTDSETFFGYQIFVIPIPRLFSVPKFFETDSETFFGTHFF